MMDCNLFLNNECQSKFINFSMFRDHLETEHEMDLLGIEMLSKKFKTKLQARTKLFMKIEKGALIEIIKNWMK